MHTCSFLGSNRPPRGPSRDYRAPVTGILPNQHAQPARTPARLLRPAGQRLSYFALHLPANHRQKHARYSMIVGIGSPFHQLRLLHTIQYVGDRRRCTCSAAANSECVRPSASHNSFSMPGCPRCRPSRPNTALALAWCARHISAINCPIGGEPEVLTATSATDIFSLLNISTVFEEVKSRHSQHSMADRFLRVPLAMVYHDVGQKWPYDLGSPKPHRISSRGRDTLSERHT